MYAQLGDIRFKGLKSLSGLASQYKSVWAEHALINSKSRLQFTGEEPEELSLNMKLHKSFIVPENVFDQLNKYRIDGEILPLVLGNGDYVGDYVILSITKTVEEADALGNIISMVLDIKLKEYYEPE